MKKTILVSLLLLSPLFADEARDWGKKMDLTFGKLMHALPAERKPILRAEQDEWNKQDLALAGVPKINHIKKRIFELDKQWLAQKGEKVSQTKSAPEPDDLPLGPPDIPLAEVPELESEEEASKEVNKWGDPKTAHEKLIDVEEKKTQLIENGLKKQKSKTVTISSAELSSIGFTLNECCFEVGDDADRAKLLKINSWNPRLSLEVVEKGNGLEVTLLAPNDPRLDELALDSKAMILLFQKGVIRKVVHQGPGTNGTEAISFKKIIPEFASRTFAPPLVVSLLMTV